MVGVLSNAVLVIEDNDPIYIEITDGAVTRPLTGPTTVYFPVTLSGSSVRTEELDFATISINAEAGVDYVDASGRLQFNPGITNLLVPVSVLDTGVQEGAKTLALALSNPTNATLSNTQGLGTIYDGTQGVLQLSTSTYNATEGVSVNVTVQRIGGTLGSVSVPFINGVGAMAGEDFNWINGVLTFANGEASKSLTVEILNDALPENEETISIELGKPTNTTLGSPAFGIIKIADDDLPPPQLLIQSLGNSCTVSWPTQAVDFTLQQSATMAFDDWSTVEIAPSIVVDRFTVTNSYAATNRFFRLRR